MQIERSSSSERRVSRQQFTIGGCWGGRGSRLDWFGGFDGWSRVLEGGGGGLSGEKDPFLACCWGLWRGVFGCGDLE